MTERTAVLVMAYGTARDLDDVETYYTDIRHGRPPSPELLEELKDRYRAIGGRSPLLEITHLQAEGVGERVGIPAFVGQKHSSPSIPDAVAEMKAAGIERAIGLVLAPHYSSMSIGDYERRARAAAEEHVWDGKLEMIESWHLEPDFISWLASRVRRALEELTPAVRDSAHVVFSAHSLPAQIVASGDPYPEQLEATARAVAETLNLERWRTGWQSAGRTTVPWLGPDITEVIPELQERGAKGIVICPCGFVADHLEVLYDVDIEAKELAAKIGVELVRTEMPNVDPAFLDALSGVVRRRLHQTA